MPLSTDVKLPKQVTPRWPDRCVACGRASPGASARLVDRSTTWWTTVTLQFGKRLAVHAPACAGCARRLEWRQRLDFLAMVATVGAGLWVGASKVAPRLPGWPWSLVVGACALLAYLPVVVVRVAVSPPRFGITAWGDAIDYEFLDEGYARDFAALNGGQAR